VLVVYFVFVDFNTRAIAISFCCLRCKVTLLFVIKTNLLLTFCNQTCIFDVFYEILQRKWEKEKRQSLDSRFHILNKY